MMTFDVSAACPSAGHFFNRKRKFEGSREMAIVRAADFANQKDETPSMFFSETQGLGCARTPGSSP